MRISDSFCRGRCQRTRDPHDPHVFRSPYYLARPEYQAEVGLLTRTIKVQGAEVDSTPRDTVPRSCQLYDHNGYETSAFGYDQVACPDTYLTGYGGHIIHREGGKGYVEGVELYRMGQTNFLGRYPIHYHVLANGCSDCYFRDSSVHESYYRCISIHGTHNLTVSENVAYDVTGYCYYLEDGVEEDNTLSYNLASHIHFIGKLSIIFVCRRRNPRFLSTYAKPHPFLLGKPALGDSQKIKVVEESPNLLLPADIAASGFYITNMHNIIIGNVASGGWAGFAFPVLASPLGPHRNWTYVPKEKVSLLIDGNTGKATSAYSFSPIFLSSLPVHLSLFRVSFSSFHRSLLELIRGILFWRRFVLQRRYQQTRIQCGAGQQRR